MRKVAVHVAAWLAWTGTLWWFWMLLVSEWNRIEIVAASCVAPVAAGFAEAARARGVRAVRVPLAWVWRARSVPLVVVADFGVVTWVLVRSALRGRRVEGTFRVKPFPAGGDDPAGVGVRAWTVLAAGYSPNAYVIDVDAERDLVLLHDLVPLAASEEPA